MDEKNQKWVLFWSRLLYPVIYEELDGAKLTHYVENLCATETLFPNGSRKKPSPATVWRKVAAYRQGGIDALCRRKRCDIGQSRTLSAEVIAKAVEIKKDLPSRSATTINNLLEHCCGKKIPPSTLYRHLQEAGATKVKLGVSKTKVRCRWDRDHSNSLWLGDFQDGPMVLIDGQARRTYLSAFIDCHSRYVVSARYYLRENTAILIDTLLRAWQMCGKPRALYVDNGKVYYAKALELACASLQIRLLHRPPREPEPGGKIEKFFQTSQGRFEAEVRAGSIMNLDELNRKFSAWLDMDYHEAPHGEIGQAPRQCYQSGLLVTEPVDLCKAIRFFMLRVERTVHRDFSDVSVDARLYKVDEKLRGDRVIVRYDPFGDLREVHIYSQNDEFLGMGTLHERERREQRSCPSGSPHRPQHDYLGILVEKQEEKMRLQSQGIDFSRVLAQRVWPFLSFVTSLACLMGRKGGASAFSALEYEALNRIYARNPKLTEPILQEAFAKAKFKDFPNIVYQIQQLMEN